MKIIYKGPQKKKGQIQNFIVAPACEQKHWKKSKKNISGDQWKIGKFGKNEGWHE